MARKTRTQRQNGIIALLILVVIWGMLPVIPRFLSADFRLFQQVYLRMALGFIISVLLFRKSISFDRIVSAPKGDLLLIAFRATAYYLFGVVLHTQSLLLTTISNVTLIGTVPITPILGFILLRETFSLRKAVLISVAFAGALLVAVTSTSDFSVGTGELLAFLSSVSISVALISRKWQSKHLTDQDTATLVLLIAALEILTVSIASGEGLPLDNWDLNAVLFLIAGGILNAGTSFFSNYGLARVDAVLSGTILMLEPVLASLFAYIIFSEIPLPKDMLGGLIIIASVILMHRLEARTVRK